APDAQRLVVGTEVDLEGRPEHPLGSVAGPMDAELLDVPAAEAHGVRPRLVGNARVRLVDQVREHRAGEPAGLDAPQLVHLARVDPRSGTEVALEAAHLPESLRLGQPATFGLQLRLDGDPISDVVDEGAE